MDLKLIVHKIKNGEVEAFTSLVKQYQNIAFAYAYSLLKDFQGAQDVTQEAFIVSYYQISQLQDPDAFPGWLKGIVRNQCYRQLRRKDHRWESLAEDAEMPDEKPAPDMVLSRKEEQRAVLTALDSLSEQQRAVVSLYYVEEHSQQDVAAFLEISVSDVNNSLHAARKTLKRRLEPMAGTNSKTKMLPKDFAEGIGKILEIQGRVIDAELSPSFTPVLFDDLEASAKTGAKLTVVQRMKNGRVRCFMSGEGEEIKTGSKIKNDSKPSYPVLRDEAIREAVENIGTSTPENPEIFETGIKVIDLLCPFPKTGNVGLVGSTGAGRSAVVAEMYKKFQHEKGRLSLFFFVAPIEASSLSAMIEHEPDLAVDEGGPLQTAWLISANATEPDFVRTATYLDSRPFFSPVMAVQGRWPAIDPLISNSSLLKPGIVSDEHYEIATRVREILTREEVLMKDPVFFEYLALGAKQKARERAHTFPDQRLKELSPEEQTLVLRARKLRNFFTQPFYVTAHFTKVEGVSVPLAETLETSQHILDGEMDEVAAKEFLYIGGRV